MQIVLNQRGNFQYPGILGQQPITTPSPSHVATAPKSVQVTTNGESSSIDLVLSDLKKRGASRPRKVSTLTSTIKAPLKQHQKLNTDAEVESLVTELHKRGRLIVSDTKVTYKLG